MFIAWIKLDHYNCCTWFALNIILVGSIFLSLYYLCDLYTCRVKLYSTQHASDVLKTYKAKVENQLSKRIKSFISYCGGEYYGRYDRSGEQRPESFAKFLDECGIVP